MDNKKFWKDVKPFFSDKGACGQKINLVKDNDIISNDSEVAEVLNNFFKSAVKSLDIDIDRNLLNNYISNDINNPIDMIIKRYASHPSILKINEFINLTESFDFKEVDLIGINQEIRKLNPKKSTTFKNIPTKLVKITNEICSPIIHCLFNSSIRNCTFPDKLKMADISPIFKKVDSTSVTNYRPVSILPTISKIYERLIQNQLLEYIDKFLSPFMCGYRKGYSAQYALVALLEKWKTTLDKQGYAGAILMDLSKAFDTIDHDLLVAKLYAYGVDKSALKLIKSYLSNRWQRTKVNTALSSWFELMQGVPQGSVLGPLLFNIYINDLFWFNEQTEACNFADDTTLYSCDIDLRTLLQRLEHDTMIAIEWFGWNNMKLNEEKCHLLIAGHKYEHIWAKVGAARIWESQKETLLGINIDNKLMFNHHISNLCKKAHCKLSALMRLCRLYGFQQCRLLMK